MSEPGGYFLKRGLAFASAPLGPPPSEEGAPASGEAAYFCPSEVTHSAEKLEIWRMTLSSPFLAQWLVPVPDLPTRRSYLAAPSLRTMEMVASGLSSPVSASVLPSPKSSAVSAL